MYDVLDVSRYVINYSARKENWVSNLKLQKLLYFIQTFFLLEYDKPCFSENIEAWIWGPVVPEAYYEFKNNGALPISEINIIFEGDWKEKERKFNPEDIFTKEHLSNMNEIIDLFGDYSSNDLVQTTCKQNPWKNSYIENKTEIVTNSSIIKYFRK